MATYSIVDAGKQLGGLARHVAAENEHVVLTDHGQAMVVMISPAELERLEIQRDLAVYELEKATGALDAVSFDEVVHDLGLADWRGHVPDPGAPGSARQPRRIRE